MRQEVKDVISLIDKGELADNLKKIPRGEIVAALYLSGYMTIDGISKFMGMSKSFVNHYVRHIPKKYTKTPQELRAIIDKVVTAEVVKQGIETRLSAKKYLNQLINNILKEAEGLKWRSKGEAIKTAIELQKLGDINENPSNQVNVNLNFTAQKEEAKKLLNENNIENELDNVINAQYEVVDNDK